MVDNVEVGGAGEIPKFDISEFEKNLDAAQFDENALKIDLFASLKSRGYATIRSLASKEPDASNQEVTQAQFDEYLKKYSTQELESLFKRGKARSRREAERLEKLGEAPKVDAERIRNRLVEKSTDVNKDIAHQVLSIMEIRERKAVKRKFIAERKKISAATPIWAEDKEKVLATGMKEGVGAGAAAIERARNKGSQQVDEVIKQQMALDRITGGLYHEMGEMRSEFEGKYGSPVVVQEDFRNDSKLAFRLVKGRVAVVVKVDANQTFPFQLGGQSFKTYQELLVLLRLRVEGEFVKAQRSPQAELFAELPRSLMEKNLELTKGEFQGRERFYLKSSELKTIIIIDVLNADAFERKYRVSTTNVPGGKNFATEVDSGRKAAAAVKSYFKQAEPKFRI